MSTIITEQETKTELRSIKVTYSNGEVINTSMAAHLDDEEMLNHFKVGKWFNLGSVTDDMQQVVNAEITDGRKVGLTLLADMKQLAERAFNWQSFNPEKRGKQTLKEHEAELIKDMEHIRAISNEETAQRYITKYKAKMSAWLGSESNCASTMITGGSNFPVRQQEKRHRWADNKYTEFVEWRTRIIAAIEKAQRRAAKAEIDPIQDLQNRIAEKEKAQEQYKLINATIRKGKTDQARFVALCEAGFSEKLSLELIKPDFAGRIGIPAYMLTNNNAEIKRLKDRLAVETKKAAISEKVGGNISHQFEGYEVIINFDIDRIQVKHDQKPSQEVINSLKGIAFKWSPSQGVWQRQLTANALYAFNLTFKTNIKIAA